MDEFGTDSATLKRSLDDTAFAQSFRLRARHDEQELVSLDPSSVEARPHHGHKRRVIGPILPSSMLVHPTATMSGTFPSFMSVYDSAKGNLYRHASQPKTDQSKAEHEDYVHYIPDSNTNLHITSHPPPRPIQRRVSVNSSISYSTESSPTTTSSTFDSPLINEMPGSPSSSPESASSAAPPKSFQSSLRMPDPSVSRLSADIAKLSPAFPDEPRKNVKNLTLDMRLPTLLRPSSSAGVESLVHPFSAPTSPLKEPLRTGRRKPTNLTIRTPGFNQLSFSKRLGDVPPTPSHATLLHQPLASPAFPALASPGKGPVGGMHLALPNIAQHCNRDSLSSNSGSTLSSEANLPSLREEEYQPPKSQEAQEQGYTEGPVQIYDTGVYLYLEPSATEASQFDTVINCAKEVKDPFESTERKSETVVAVWRNHTVSRSSISEPQTAMSEVSFKSAFEWPSTNSPSTPKATTPKADTSLKLPEYVHVRWDHNSEILDDLYPLCQIIDDRVKQGKKVLVHCQLGVSRSASLIIAYGLFKGYESNFHSMYMAVKQRSRWVGPNMSLIYQLNDFCSRCAKGDYQVQSKAADPSWFVHSHDSARTPTAAPASLPETPKVPALTANAPSGSTRPPLRLNKELPPVPRLSDQPSPPPTATSASKPMRASPRPRPAMQRVPSSTSPETNQPIKRSASRPLPLRERSFFASPMSIPPHRPRAVPTLGLVRLPSSLMDLARQDVPESPSLFSPRATEFVAQPFGINTAGDLATTAPKRRQPPPGAFPGGSEWRHSLRQSMDLSQDLGKILDYDPRSPHQQGESKEIFRHIDDVL